MVDKCVDVSVSVADASLFVGRFSLQGGATVYECPWKTQKTRIFRDDCSQYMKKTFDSLAWKKDTLEVRQGQSAVARESLPTFYPGCFFPLSTEVIRFASGSFPLPKYNNENHSKNAIEFSLEEENTTFSVISLLLPEETESLEKFLLDLYQQDQNQRCNLDNFILKSERTPWIEGFDLMVIVSSSYHIPKSCSEYSESSFRFMNFTTPQKDLLRILKDHHRLAILEKTVTAPIEEALQQGIKYCTSFVEKALSFFVKHVIRRLLRLIPKNILRWISKFLAKKVG